MGITIAHDDVEGHRRQQVDAERLGNDRTVGRHGREAAQPGPEAFGFSGTFILRVRVQPERLTEIFLVQTGGLLRDTGSPPLDGDPAELGYDHSLVAALGQCPNGCFHADRTPSFQSRHGHPRDAQPLGEVGLMQTASLPCAAHGLAELD